LQHKRFLDCDVAVKPEEKGVTDGSINQSKESRLRRSSALCAKHNKDV